MFSSLRFRLPAFFLAGVALAGIVSTAIAVQLLPGSHPLAVALRAEARGARADRSSTRSRRSARSTRAARRPTSPAAELEKATGDQPLLRRRPDLLPARLRPPRARPRRRSAIDWQALDRRPDGDHVRVHAAGRAARRFLAVGQPLAARAARHFGALIVAKKKTELTARLALAVRAARSSRSASGCSSPACSPGTCRAGSRSRCSRSRRRPTRSREGKYDVAVPTCRASGEVSHLAERFRADGRAARRGRGAGAELPDVRLARAADAADRDPRPRRGAARRAVAEDPETRPTSLDVVAAEAERLERLVGDVLDLAKLDAHRFTVLHEEVDMGRLVDQAYAAFGEEARRRGIDYRCDVDGAAGDRLRRRPRASRSSPTCSRTPSAGRPTAAASSSRSPPTNGTVSVSVADTGPGIQPSERERIFRPFWSRDGGGTGLGPRDRARAGGRARRPDRARERARRRAAASTCVLPATLAVS